MIKMSNSYFSGGSSELYDKIVASSVDVGGTLTAGSVKAGNVLCDRLDNSGTFSITNNIIYLTGNTGTNYALTPAQISYAITKGYLFIYSDYTTVACTISVGADTSARAAELLSLFGISDNVPTRLFRVVLLTANSAFVINMKNDSSSTNNVRFNSVTPSGGALITSTVAHTQPLVAASCVQNAEGYILVSKFTPATPTESGILFTILEQCTST